MMNTNFIIVFEGINAIGKSTLINELKDNKEWIFFKYPHNRNLKKAKDFIKEMNEDYIKIKNLKHKVIIIDRYDLSTHIFNNYEGQAMLKPNFYIILTCEKDKLSEVRKRLILRNRKNYDIDLKHLENYWSKYEALRKTNNKKFVFFDAFKITKEEIIQWINKKKKKYKEDK